MSDDLLITAIEAAKLLEVTERTVWRYIKKGTLQATKQQDRTLVSREAVLSLKAKGGTLPVVQGQPYNPDTHVLVERKHYEELLGVGAALVESTEKNMSRITEITTNHFQDVSAKFLNDLAKLLEDQSTKKSDPRLLEVDRLRQENEQLQERLRQVKLYIDTQNNISQMLNITFENKS
jgi:excisionase family DNA binding protein